MTRRSRSDATVPAICLHSNGIPSCPLLCGRRTCPGRLLDRRPLAWSILDTDRRNRANPACILPPVVGRV